MNEFVKRLITFEEHFICPEVDDRYRKVVDRSQMSETQKAMLAHSAQTVTESPISEIGELRLAWMDENGIDMQVIQYGNHSPSDLPAKDSVALCRDANDYLSHHCRKDPKRFVGFGILPVDSPEEAAKEAERAVKELGLKGFTLKATFRGMEFLDSKRFSPIFESIAALDVPVTIHPSQTMPAVTKVYYEGDNISPMASLLLSGSGIGWHYEAGVAYLRMIFSGLLDRYPHIQMIIGHWGEMLPFYFDRMDMVFDTLGKGLLERKVSEYFRENMYVTPSGMYDKEVMDIPLKVCLETFGADRILWANDYPYRLGTEMANSRDWINRMEIPIEDKEKIAHLNGEKLLKI